MLPEQAVLRFAGGVEDLADALTQLALMDDEALATMSVAARRYVAKLSWPEIARKTLDEMLKALQETRYRSVRDEPVRES
jgi:glycosyltransferase involved in cell wall biosynthesis